MKREIIEKWNLKKLQKNGFSVHVIKDNSIEVFQPIISKTKGNLNSYCPKSTLDYLSGSRIYIKRIVDVGLILGKIADKHFDSVQEKLNFLHFIGEHLQVLMSKDVSIGSFITRSVGRASLVQWYLFILDQILFSPFEDTRFDSDDGLIYYRISNDRVRKDYNFYLPHKKLLSNAAITVMMNAALRAARRCDYIITTPAYGLPRNPLVYYPKMFYEHLMERFGTYDWKECMDVEKYGIEIPSNKEIELWLSESDHISVKKE